MPDIEEGNPPPDIKCASTSENEGCLSTNGEQLPNSSSPPASAPTTSCHEYPEGGTRSYLTVFGAFLALFCTFGQMNSFGTYQTWYKQNQLHHLPPSTISWIGSLQLWVFFFSVWFHISYFGHLSPDTHPLVEWPNRMFIRQVWPHIPNDHRHGYLYIRNNDDQHIYEILSVYSISGNSIWARRWLTVSVVYPHFLNVIDVE